MKPHRKDCLSNAGFTLIEVLIAMIVMTAGLLGLAKIQALAISSTQVAGNRALIALQTASLTAAMHANRAFWASGLAPATFSVNGVTVTDSTNKLSNGISDGCRSFCTPTQLAANDVKAWADDLENQFPGYAAKVDCSDNAIPPVSCTIFIRWSEKTVAFNKSTATGVEAQVNSESFSVHFEP